MHNLISMFPHHLFIDLSVSFFPLKYCLARLHSWILVTTWDADDTGSLCAEHLYRHTGFVYVNYATIQQIQVLDRKNVLVTESSIGN